jgi:hypothetical protein
MGFLLGIEHWNRFLIDKFVLLPSFIIPAIFDAHLSCHFLSYSTMALILTPLLQLLVFLLQL